MFGVGSFQRSREQLVARSLRVQPDVNANWSTFRAIIGLRCYLVRSERATPAVGSGPSPSPTARGDSD